MKTLTNKAYTPKNAPVDLPFSLKNSIPRAALVGRAALTLANVAGIGLTAYSLYNLLSDDSLTSTGAINGPVTTGCQIPAMAFPSCTTARFFASCPGSQMAAYLASCANVTYTTFTMASGNLRLFNNSTLVSAVSYINTNGTPQISNPTESQYSDFVNQKEPNNTTLYNALKTDADKGKSGSSFPFFVMNTAVTDISANPYVSPTEIVTTETQSMPDGSTQTTTIEEAYAYYPTLSGIDADTGFITSTPVEQNPFTGQLQPVQLNNLEPGSEEIDYQTITQTETTTTNNTTGQTSTTTSQTNHGTGTTTIINNNTTTNNTNTDICQANPAILACQTLGTATPPETVEVPTHEIQTTFEPPASVPGQCPQPIVRTLSNGQTEITYDYDKLCEMATSLRPFIILFSLLGAAYYVSTGIKSRAFV